MASSCSRFRFLVLLWVGGPSFLAGVAWRWAASRDGYVP